jgi:hypothetical protein
VQSGGKRVIFGLLVFVGALMAGGGTAARTEEGPGGVPAEPSTHKAVDEMLRVACARACDSVECAAEDAEANALLGQAVVGQLATDAVSWGRFERYLESRVLGSSGYSPQTIERLLSDGACIPAENDREDPEDRLPVGEYVAAVRKLSEGGTLRTPAGRKDVSGALAFARLAHGLSGAAKHQGKEINQPSRWLVDVIRKLAIDYSRAAVKGPVSPAPEDEPVGLRLEKINRGEYKRSRLALVLEKLLVYETLHQPSPARRGAEAVSAYATVLSRLVEGFLEHQAPRVEYRAAFVLLKLFPHHAWRIPGKRSPWASQREAGVKPVHSWLGLTMDRLWSSAGAEPAAMPWEMAAGHLPAETQGPSGSPADHRQALEALAAFHGPRGTFSSVPDAIVLTRRAVDGATPAEQGKEYNKVIQAARRLHTACLGDLPAAVAALESQQRSDG